MKNNIEQTRVNHNCRDDSQSEWLANFIEIYSQLSTDNLTLLEKIYHPDILFIDPIHQVKGFDNLHQYFSDLYENLTSCHFTIQHVFEQNDEAAIYWEMTYQHPKLNSGQMITVQGHSHIKGADKKVIYHHDYLDVGAMLYEHLPLLGRFIQWIKTRVSK
jgi:hypothetical protein